jgi:type III secretion system FlhB-like substrate exporter
MNCQGEVLIPSATAQDCNPAVVITNPTHYAVALAYGGGDAAPQVVAKGVDELAARIRSVAEGAGVPLVANPPLARALHRLEVGAEIPAEHYQAVADASPVPVLLYNFTSVTGLNMAPDVVAGLSAHPNIVGLKDSNGDIGQVAGVVARVPPDFAVLVGSASTLHPAMVAGASGDLRGDRRAGPARHLAVGLGLRGAVAHGDDADRPGWPPRRR